MNGHAKPKVKAEVNPQNDLKLLYNALVHHLERVPSQGPKSSVLPWASDVRLLLDTKQFEKNYYGEVAAPPPTTLRSMLRLLVTVKLDEGVATHTLGKRERESRIHKVAIPCEILVLPEYSSVKQLKEEIGKAMRELYTIFENFEVSEIISGIRSAKIADEARLCDLKIDKFIVVKGKGISTNTLFYHIGGLEDWIVDCLCGTKDDDGERMVECERCSNWVHTRCYGYPDSAPCPENFVCGKCRKRQRL
mmetsp:Transcript_6229/g.15147  ORF Transcript_6229/g.15147 Transcript_6229/m.15147 type:complete len:249 (+) Transcript_6229:103-849(+)